MHFFVKNIYMVSFHSCTMNSLPKILLFLSFSESNFLDREEFKELLNFFNIHLNEVTIVMFKKIFCNFKNYIDELDLQRSIIQC